MKRRAVLGVTAALAVPNISFAQATVHEIQMFNVHPDDPKKRMVFAPLVKVGQPGDTFKFVAVDKGHNTVSVDGMIPDGTEAWKGKINEEVEVTLSQPGVYGYQCVPHAGLGMVGLIIVQGDGMMDNVEAAKAVRQRGRAKQTWDEIWAQVDSEGLLA